MALNPVVTLVSDAAPGAGAGAVAWRRVALDFVVLTKPRITLMVVLTALAGVWLAVRSGAAPALDWTQQAVALAGIALVVSGAGALNMVLERDTDALMTRTAGRPLPAGRLRAAPAAAFGATLAAVALVLLAACVNTLTAALAAASLVTYAAVYTPLKRLSAAALLVGAVPGAMPPLLGWTAATGAIGAPALALFAVLFFWQLPHFIAIATFRQGEFARAGIRTVPGVHGERVARWLAAAACLPLIVASSVLVPLAGRWYGAIAVALGGLLFALAAWPFARVERWARRLFFATLLYLPLLVAAMMVSP